MKQLLITIAAVVMVGCGNPEADRALFTAVKAESIQAIEQAIAAGADVNAKEQRDPGWTPLHIATQLDHKEIAKLLIINDAYVNAKDNYGLTSLHWAARVGCKETAELLIEKGTDLNAKDDYGSTSLHNAAGTGHKEIAELLLAKGADMNAKDGDGETALDEAVQNEHTETADLIRKHGGKAGDWFKAGESIHIAARVGHIEAVKQHLASGADVNTTNYVGETPLHHAAIGGHKEIAELLIVKDADVNATDVVLGYTPLDRIDFDSKDIADLLRKHGGKTGEELKAEGK